MSEKIIINVAIKPPLGGMGGSIHDWEKSLDPFHKDAFPNEFKQVGTDGERANGWMALDWCGNAIGFVSDGAEMSL